MQTLQADYFATYRNLKLSRDAKGVLVAEFHSDGGPFIMSAQAHTEFVDAFHRIGQDRANKIVIMTGAGGNFISDVDWRSFGDVADPGVWSRIHDEGLQTLENIANIRVPVIAAVEGRAHIHSDFALLASVIVAAEGATFQDVGHFAVGVTPGDGIFITWSYRAGGGRAEAFLLNPQPLPARSAYEWGVRCRGSTERQGSGKGSGTGRFVPAGSGSDAPEYAHSLHSTTEGAHRAGSRLRTIARRSVISRRGKIEEMKSAAVT
jgi:enoyl-CoA hydratase/carnithine racemase